MEQYRHQNGREHFPLGTVNPGYQEEGLHYYSDVIPPIGSYPGYNTNTSAHIPLDRRGSDASSYHSDTNTGPRHRWAAQEMRDTSILLERLPSRQLERLASDVAQKSSFRQKSKKRKSLHGTIHIPRGKDVSKELMDQYNEDPNLMNEFDIKDTTLPLSSKMRIRSLTKQRPGRLKSLKYSCGIAWMHFRQKMSDFAFYLQLWKGHMKKIEGHFGTGVLSYFLFLQWIFYINIPVFIVTFGFVIVPQLLDSSNISSNKTFTGKELLLGTGWFNDTIMYYGFYTNGTISNKYEMQFAYLLTCGAYYIMCIIIIALSISRSYKTNYIEGSGAYDFYYVTRVFCGWDYGIMAVDAAKLKHKGIWNELKEYLSGIQKEKKQATCGEKCKWIFIRLATNLFVLGSIGGCGYLIYFLSTNKVITNIAQEELKVMVMPICVSGIILILPLIFSFIGQLEKYEKPKTELYVGMVRTMLLKATVLAVLVSSWYRNTIESHPCWETYVGQEIYRLVIVDFIFTLLVTFFIEFIKRLFKEHCCKFLNYPEFDIGRNTLNLIYSQALCWLGTYFCPILSIVVIIKLFIIFYVKRVSVILNCKPSLRPWRAARAHTIFMGFLFVFFLLSAAAVACGIIFIRPSLNCGPFRNKDKPYQIVTDFVANLNHELNWLQVIINIISSPGFIAGTLVVLCVLTYYMRIVMVGHKEMVTLLQQQLAMEGKDKAYLLKMLQEASSKHKDKPKPPDRSRQLSPGAASTIENSRPDGRNVWIVTHPPPTDADDVLL
ncbi:hypothetical protein CHS0354_037370 [Potamilus streckersoni]|uniref:TMC domain-containing protein n=1 Tax=Potamilus streckersoni TaxID=2493646 RepID=A0AAE0S4A3_9BIVA|nr:hypothetical protein CHS0354_037370 [Potamilus streckersoni]